jgi:hypothetical protein
LSENADFPLREAQNINRYWSHVAMCRRLDIMNIVEVYHKVRVLHLSWRVYVHSKKMSLSTETTRMDWTFEFKCELAYATQFIVGGENAIGGVSEYSYRSWTSRFEQGTYSLRDLTHDIISNIFQVAFLFPLPSPNLKPWELVRKKSWLVYEARFGTESSLCSVVKPTPPEFHHTEEEKWKTIGGVVPPVYRIWLCHSDTHSSCKTPGNGTKIRRFR